MDNSQNIRHAIFIKNRTTRNTMIIARITKNVVFIISKFLAYKGTNFLELVLYLYLNIDDNKKLDRQTIKLSDT